MGNLLSNFLKKPEQLKSKHIVVGSPTECKLYKQTHIYIQKIIPNRIVMDKNVYEITYLDKMYHLGGFQIETENNRVFNVRLFGFHPNCNLETNEYCIPDFKKGCQLTDGYIRGITTNIQTYYFDACYFKPIKRNLRYRKLKSIYIQMNN